MFKNLKIGVRLIFCFAVTILLSTAIIVFALTGLQGANQDLNNLVDHQFKADSSIKMCRIYVNVAARGIRDMYIENNPSKFSEQRAKVEENLDLVSGYLGDFKEAYNTEDGLYEKYEASFNNWSSIGDQIMSYIEKGNIAEANTMIITKCDPALNELVGVAKEINSKTDAMQSDALAKNASNNTKVSVIVLLLLAVGVAFCVAMSIYVTKSIVRPTKEIMYAADQMSKGILGTDITYESKDEIGDLATSMRTSMRRLSVYIRDIDQALATMAGGDFNIAPSEHFVGDFENIEKSFMGFSQKMSDTLSRINEGAGQVSSGSDQVSVGAQVLSEGATEQAAAIVQLTETVEVVTDQINTNAKEAKEANALSNKAGEGVVSSNEKMKQMIEAMSEISHKSSEIGKIIKTIDDIAFQTNILALNAAVEAARAGSAGKGFAVVADEVRNLAQKSAEAAKNTTDLIEGTVIAVNNGTKIADETAKSLLAIVDDASKVTTMVVNIAKASEEQAVGTKQISEGMQQISDVVQTNSATAQESAAASEELSSQAELLKELVSDFKLIRS